MAATSMMEELLAAIKLPNLKQLVAYLLEDDAITVDMYTQSSYAREYAINTSNIHWGGEVHHGHMYDIYAGYSKKDSVKVHLDMLQFVTANQKHYDWNAHLYLLMHNLDLNTWVQPMSFWGNGADALAIYPMSDMLGIHTTVITRTKPRTTIEGGIVDNVFDLLDLSVVKLAYLGQDKYAVLCRKADKNDLCYIGPNFNYMPMITPPSMPSTEYLDTANTLLELSASLSKTEQRGRQKPKPKPDLNPNQLHNLHLF